VSTLTGAPVRLGGDGLCMALGERWRGAGRGAQFLLGMVVSTGVGGGLVLDGAPYDGRTGNAGHVGHVVVDPDGGPCSCGGRGCVETIAAGPRMAQWAREHGWEASAEADAKELADAANAGNTVAVQAFRRGAIAVAAMIASVGAVCDLDLVVVGGGVATSGALLFDPLREALRTYARLDFLRGLRVLPAELGGDAGLVGAAALLLAEEGDRRFG
jgi:glucokinase